MINKPRDYDNKQVARMLGEVRLQLPPVFRKALCKAVDDGLAVRSHKVDQELKDLIIGQVALTLRASDFSYILEAEAKRHEREQKAKSEVLDFERLETIKRQNSDLVKPFFKAVTGRPRAAFKDVQQQFEGIKYRCGLLDDQSADLLRSWAAGLYVKFQKLIGAADV